MAHDCEGILDFWFAGAANDPAGADKRSDLWFGVDAAVDATIRERYEPTVQAALRGELGGWAAQPRSALALVVVLDQFPRNVWRGTAQAFSCDGHALRVSQAAIGAGFMSALSPIENSFLILPFQHCESLETQRESVRLSQQLVEDAPAAWRKLLEEYHAFAVDHLRVIERFGRFPHRNRVLGRASTEEEKAYLTAGAQTYGQGEG